MLIHPATAVPERLYAGFARFLTTRGFAALTYDYRGIGASRPARLTKLQARMRDWIELDVGAAIAWARDTHRAVPLLAVGHSVGGHAVGLSAGTAHLRAAVLVAAHAGSTRLIESAAERLKVRLILHVLGPLASALLGYVPGKRLGLGEDLPAGVFREWSRWTTLPHYFFDDPTLGAAERFSKQRLPILAVGFDDDPWANRPRHRPAGKLPDRSGRRTPADRSARGGHRPGRAHGLLPQPAGRRAMAGRRRLARAGARRAPRRRPPIPFHRSREPSLSEHRRLFFLLNIGQRRVQRWVDRKAETDARASAAQAGVLFFLAKQDGALIGEVGAALQLAPSAMTGLADRMAKAGLLTRHADSDDGRATRLFLTDEGHAALKRARVLLRELNGKLCDGFSDDELDVVARWLNALQQRFPAER